MGLRRFPVLVLAACLPIGLALPGLLGAQRAPSPRVLVWAVDGLSYDAFMEAKRRGLFRRFEHAGRHVAPYPSMSHPSWTEVTGARTLFGNKGRLPSVEASWFDLDAMRVADDPRQVFARQASPYNYMRAFDWFFDPITEPLMYFEGDRLADRELAQAAEHVLQEFTGNHHVVFLGAGDAIAHTHRNGLFRYLVRLNATINRVLDSLAHRGGRPVESWIVSDHGNVGAFVEGAPERYLTPVSLDAAFRVARLIRRDSGQLTRANEASVVTLALASMVNVYFADLGARRRFATAALADPAVELVTWLEVREADRYVVIASRARGEAHLRWRAGGDVAVTRISGNPLAIPDALLSEPGVLRWVHDSVMRAATVHGPYPDAADRLVRSATKEVENAPDLIVNLRDGYCWSGHLGTFVRMVRTHGALGARSTLGVVASTARSVPTFVRSREMLPLMGLSPTRLFRRVLTQAPHDARALADSLQRAPTWVGTGRDDGSADAAFLRRVRAITLSAEYFPLDVLQTLTTTAHPRPSERAARTTQWQRTQRALQRSDPIRGISRHMDSLVALVDPAPNFSNVADLQALLERAQVRLRGIPDLAPLATLPDLWRRGSGSPGTGAALRRATMAMWTLPYYLDAVLDGPESDSIVDPRDRSFAAAWHDSVRTAVRREPARLLRDTVLAPRLFREVLAERQLLRATEGARVPLLYDAPVPELAVVYVPGIFGELFDGEIWQRGLRAIRTRLGVRVIPAPVDGRCSAAHNARALLVTMHEDTRRRVARGYDAPRYVVVGYSKGGVDAAEALALDTLLARSQVAALVSVAAPHGGSPVAERADLPDALLQWSIRAPRGAACDTTRAVASLWPAARAGFWSAAGRRLDEQVPLVTLSLDSDMHHAHPFMKLTKRIGAFSGANDGVVSLDASRVPAGLTSLHLGSVAGDHIAARSASQFPQESVLEAVVLTLGEIGLLEPGASAAWRQAARDARARAVAGQEQEQAATPPGRVGSRGPQVVRPPLPLPGRDTTWRSDRTFRMGQLEALADRPVPLATASALPDGLVFVCDQPDMTAFRREYQFMYDAGNGGSEHDPLNGFALVPTDSTSSGRSCRLHTQRSAMKMTTVALRFSPQEFPHFALRTRVDRSVRGISPAKHGRGRNDATLKVWYVLRDDRPAAKGRRLLFGYTWAGPDANGNEPSSDSLVEGGASRRRIGFGVLPEAWILHIGGRQAEGSWTTVQRNFAHDVQRAYPAIPLEALTVVAITIQTDSDDSRGETDVRLDYLRMQPSAAPNPVPRR